MIHPPDDELVWGAPSIDPGYIERRTVDGLWHVRACDNGVGYRRPWTASYEGPPGTPKDGVAVRGRSGRLLHFRVGRLGAREGDE